MVARLPGPFPADRLLGRTLIRLNDILDRVGGYHPDPDLDLIKKAYVYSAKVHQGQIRKSGEPYLVHPLEVAGILAEMRLDEASIVTGLLHDTIEDTPAPQERIARETLDIYAPLANRLGIQWVKSELEDLSFRYLHTNDYSELTEKVEARAKQRDRFISEVVEIVRAKLTE